VWPLFSHISYAGKTETALPNVVSRPGIPGQRGHPATWAKEVREYADRNSREVKGHFWRGEETSGFCNRSLYDFTGSSTKIKIHQTTTYGTVPYYKIVQGHQCLLDMFYVEYCTLYTLFQKQKPQKILDLTLSLTNLDQ
jgi:hypothetical protein